MRIHIGMGLRQWPLHLAGMASAYPTARGHANDKNVLFSEMVFVKNAYKSDKLNKYLEYLIKIINRDIYPNLYRYIV
jgi:hypothetical protein